MESTVVIGGNGFIKFKLPHLKLHEWENYLVSMNLICLASKMQELIKSALLGCCEDNLCKALGLQ